MTAPAALLDWLGELGIDADEGEVYLATFLVSGASNNNNNDDRGDDE